MNPPHGRALHWVSPELVAEVSFATWTSDHLLRQAAFEGLREDKAADEVLLEMPKPLARETRRWAPARRTKGAAPVREPASPLTGARSRSPGKTARASARTAQAPNAGAEPDAVAGVVITHPDRVVYTPERVTKIDVARYIEQVAPRMLPHVIDRALMVMRCPNGADEPCFMQRHPGESMRRPRPSAKAPKPSAESPLVVNDLEGLIQLIQNGALEVHVSSATRKRPRHPDRLIFDLDPHESVAWSRAVEVARELERRLGKWDLPAYVKTTGGRGLHVLVPLNPPHLGPGEARRHEHRVLAGGGRGRRSHVAHREGRSHGQDLHRHAPQRGRCDVRGSVLAARAGRRHRVDADRLERPVGSQRSRAVLDSRGAHRRRHRPGPVARLGSRPRGPAESTAALRRTLVRGRGARPRAPRRSPRTPRRARRSVQRSLTIFRLPLNPSVFIRR